MLINDQTFDIGDTIKFSTINPKDTNIWKGVVVGRGGYTIASAYGDLINYYQQILSGLSSSSSIAKLAEGDFLLINMETSGGQIIKAIALDWILAESFKVVKVEQSYLIQVYTHDGSTAVDVLKILRDNGFTCKQLS